MGEVRGCQTRMSVISSSNYVNKNIIRDKFLERRTTNNVWWFVLMIIYTRIFNVGIDFNIHYHVLMNSMTTIRFVETTFCVNSTKIVWSDFRSTRCTFDPIANFSTECWKNSHPLNPLVDSFFEPTIDRNRTTQLTESTISMRADYGKIYEKIKKKFHSNEETHLVTKQKCFLIFLISSETSFGTNCQRLRIYFGL